MADKMLNAFDVWITAQGVKSRTRLRSVDNVSLEGVERLRELILEFAIQGKLVPQNSKDESATILLAKMAEEESELVQKRIIKKSKDLPPIEESEFPFELPKGWAYTRLNNIGEWGAGATPLRGRHDYYGGDIPWFKSGELSSDFISKSEETVTELALKQTSLRYNKVGDVLIAMYGATIGKSAILEVPATTNQAVCACTTFSGVYNVFLLKLLRAYNSRFINMGAGGAQPNISREKIIATVIALPPLAEQHRIVAKVDELMSLCDALEQQETHHLKSHQLLVESLLGTLTRAADAKEFQQAWKKLYEHFDDLFTTEDSIDQLKQTILQLAVMGKLAPQDPNDEPASKILKQIKEKGPYEIPKNWAWVVLQQISTVGTGATPLTTNADYYNNGDVAWVTSSATNNLFIDESETSITKKALEETNCKVYPKGTLIVAMYGQGKTRGQVSELNIDAATNQACAAIELHLKDLGHRRYLKLFFQKIYLEIRELAEGGAQPNLNLGKVKETLIPFPPLAEQKRIVSKVDELFALCDRLKERIAEVQRVANVMAENV